MSRISFMICLHIVVFSLQHREFTTSHAPMVGSTADPVHMFSPRLTTVHTSLKSPTRIICVCISLSPSRAVLVTKLNDVSSSRAQHAVLTEHLSVKKVFCVVGFSMGAQQVCPSDYVSRPWPLILQWRYMFYFRGLLLACDVS